MGGVSLGGVGTFPEGGGIERRSVMTRLSESSVVSLGAEALPVLMFGDRPPALLLLDELVRRFPGCCWVVTDPPDDEGGVGCLGALDVLLFESPPPRVF